MTETDSAQANTGLSDELMIDIQGMHKWYGEFHVLKDINLQVKKGERAGGASAREDCRRWHRIDR